MGWLRDLLKEWLCADELRALTRYRRACALAHRWNGNIPDSADTADWISAVGEDKHGADIDQFRARLMRRKETP